MIDDNVKADPDSVRRWLDRIDAIADASPDPAAVRAWLDSPAYPPRNLETDGAAAQLERLQAARVRHMQEVAGATLAILTLVLAVLSCMLIRG